MLNKPYKTLRLLQNDPHILIVTLNRPQRFNAINSEMMLDLRDLWQSLFVDSGSLRCLILTGADPAFCAGADLKERHALPLHEWQAHRAIFTQAMLAMIDCPVPVIAAVNGAAFGGGLELILACDFAYAAKTATFAQSEVKIGLIPGAMGTQHLPRACGLRRAKELALTGATFTAEEAQGWGVINKVCSSDQLAEEVVSVAKIICENAPCAIRQVKKCLNLSQQVDLKSGFNFELEAYNHLLPTADREEGIRAFNEKRKPLFTGK